MKGWQHARTRERPGASPTYPCVASYRQGLVEDIPVKGEKALRTYCSIILRRNNHTGVISHSNFFRHNDAPQASLLFTRSQSPSAKNEGLHID